MASAAGMIGIGSSLLGGIFGAQGAATKAAGEQLNIEGQMLHTIGQAFQFDVAAQEWTFKSGVEAYQQAVSLMNRDIAKQNAIWSLRTGDIKAEEAGMQARFELGAAKASQGASGIDINSGSSVHVRESMIEIGAYNQALIRADAAKTAYGHEVEASQAEAQAAVHSMMSDLDKMNAINATTAAGITRQALPLEQQAMGLAKTAGDIGVMSSLVSAAGGVSSKWLQGNFSGMLGGGGGGGPTSPGPVAAPVSTLGAGAPTFGEE